MEPVVPLARNKFKKVTVCFSDNDKLPEIFFCIMSEWGFFCNSFVTKRLPNKILVFRFQTTFLTVEPIILSFTEMLNQFFFNTDRILMRNSIEQLFDSPCHTPFPCFENENNSRRLSESGMD